MVNGLYLYSSFLVFQPLKVLFTLRITFTHIHTLNGYRGDHARSPPAHQRKLTIHTHSYTDGSAIRTNLGLSVLPKDTSTCGLEEPGIEPPIFRLVDDPLYLLNHSRSEVIRSFTALNVVIETQYQQKKGM